MRYRHSDSAGAGANPLGAVSPPHTPFSLHVYPQLVPALSKAISQQPATLNGWNLRRTAELYDHSTDEAEYHNVITNPEHETLVKRLHGLLDKEFGTMARAPAEKAKASKEH